MEVVISRIPNNPEISNKVKRETKEGQIKNSMAYGSSENDKRGIWQNDNGTGGNDN